MELDLFNYLKEAFLVPSFLVYYNLNRLLFINLDILKVFKFIMIIYYLKSKNLVKKIVKNLFDNLAIKINNSAKKIVMNLSINNALKGA